MPNPRRDVLHSFLWWDDTGFPLSPTNSTETSAVKSVPHLMVSQLKSSFVLCFQTSSGSTSGSRAETHGMEEERNRQVTACENQVASKARVLWQRAEHFSLELFQKLPFLLFPASLGTFPLCRQRSCLSEHWSGRLEMIWEQRRWRVTLIQTISPGIVVFSMFSSFFC